MEVAGAGTLTGADTVQLRELAGQLELAGSRLRAMAMTLGQRLAAGPWQGRDAERFRSRWQRELGTAVVRAAQACELAGETVRSNAEEQEAASAIDIPVAWAGTEAGAVTGVGASVRVHAAVPTSDDGTSWWESLGRTALGKVDKVATPLLITGVLQDHHDGESWGQAVTSQVAGKVAGTLGYAAGSYAGTPVGSIVGEAAGSAIGPEAVPAAGVVGGALGGVVGGLTGGTVASRSGDSYVDGLFEHHGDPVDALQEVEDLQTARQHLEDAADAASRVPREAVLGVLGEAARRTASEPGFGLVSPGAPLGASAAR